MKKIRKNLFQTAIICFTFFLTPQAQAFQTAPSTEILEYFSKFKEGSKRRYNYDYWSVILKNTVMLAGPSNRFVGNHPEPATTTRITLHNPKPSWLEGNRVYYEKLTDQQIEAVEYYRQDLEATPEVAPLATLSKDEQLAYWLNLYNVTVYAKMAREYPITNVKTVWNEGFWDQRILTVEGFKLSLNDIQYILATNWNSPDYIYGLYQGSIGGPSIQKSAFSGKNVKFKLEDAG